MKLTPRTRRWLASALAGALVLAAAFLLTRPGHAQNATPTPTRTVTRTGTVTRTATNTFIPLPTFTPGPSPTPTLTPGPGNYVVQYGDTLLTIARKFNVTIPAIRSANGLTSDLIFAGQVLRIPTPTVAPTKTPFPAGAVLYVVQPGDQLLVIARRFSVTVSAIRTANSLIGDTIRPGQVLVIPPPSPTKTPIPPGRSYVVQPGDQLRALARKWGVTVSLIKSTNGLTSDVIRVGQVLVIPTPPPPTATPTALPANAVLHVVKAGDRLSMLAARYGVTAAEIRNANKMANDTLYVGQRVVILNPTLRPIEYRIGPSDNLTRIAARFGITVELLKAANGMKGDTILEGLILIVPTKP
jgi:LysM repeat protein